MKPTNYSQNKLNLDERDEAYFMQLILSPLAHTVSNSPCSGEGDWQQMWSHRVCLFESTPALQVTPATSLPPLHSDCWIQYEPVDSKMSCKCV